MVYDVRYDEYVELCATAEVVAATLVRQSIPNECSAIQIVGRDARHKHTSRGLCIPWVSTDHTNGKAWGSTAVARALAAGYVMIHY